MVVSNSKLLGLTLGLGGLWCGAGIFGVYGRRDQADGHGKDPNDAHHLRVCDAAGRQQHACTPAHMHAPVRTQTHAQTSPSGHTSIYWALIMFLASIEHISLRCAVASLKPLQNGRGRDSARAQGATPVPIALAKERENPQRGRADRPTRTS